MHVIVILMDMLLFIYKRQLEVNFKIVWIINIQYVNFDYVYRNQTYVSILLYRGPMSNTDPNCPLHHYNFKDHKMFKILMSEAKIQPFGTGI